MVEELQREVLTFHFRPMVYGRPDYALWPNQPPIRAPV
jgi:hypothetical protein